MLQQAIESADLPEQPLILQQLPVIFERYVKTICEPKK
jgi:hypothetical protein